MSRWLLLLFAACSVGCDAPRTCVETTAFVDSETKRIGAEHAAPCLADADCVFVADDIRCDDGVIGLGGCGRAVLASRESDARTALDALQDEVCSTLREPCSRDFDCGQDSTACVDAVCVLVVN